jgi:chromosome segregation ATPase
MTPSRYVLARIAQSFGISRRAKRMSDAAFETHLLREAEQILGEAVWQRTEEAEEISVEYWNLRKIQRERTELEKQLHEAEQTLANAHDERARLLNQTTDAQQELEEKRAGLMKKLELIARERDKVVHLAKEIRRRYEGLKTKLAVLAEEDDPENEKAIADAKQKMRDLRADFQSLKKKRTQIGERLDRGDAILSQVEDKLGDRRKVRRDEAARTFHIIGKANRDISNHRAQLGLIETQEQQLYAEIGRYVSRNHKASPLLQSIYRENQALIDIMIALRRSIIMNRKLTSQFD